MSFELKVMECLGEPHPIYGVAGISPDSCWQIGSLTQIYMASFSVLMVPCDSLSTM